MNARLFVTGTDTGVGKTVVSALLVAALRAAGRDARYFKPVQTGPDCDSTEVLRLGAVPAESSLPPGRSFALPAAPSRAAAAEGATVTAQELEEACVRHAADSDLVVEGAGGWLVPLNERETVRDLARLLGWPVLLVASTRLGTINHTLLTLESVKQSGVPCPGYVLCGREDPGLEATLAAHTDLRCVAHVPVLELHHDGGVFARSAAGLFPQPSLKHLFGLAEL